MLWKCDSRVSVSTFVFELFQVKFLKTEWQRNEVGNQCILSIMGWPEGQDLQCRRCFGKEVYYKIPPSQRIRFRSLLRLKLVQATASVARNWQESDPFQGAPFYTQDSSEAHGLMGRLFRWAFSWCLAISVKPSCRPSFLCKNSQKRLGTRQDKRSKVLQTHSCDHRQLKLTITRSEKIQLSAIDLSIVWVGTWPKQLTR